MTSMKTKILGGVLTGLMTAGIASFAHADEGMAGKGMMNGDHGALEKCSIVGADGKGMIKEGKGDCAGSTGHSCAGQNKAGDAETWIFVPKGTCDKIEGETVK